MAFVVGLGALVLLLVGWAAASHLRQSVEDRVVGELDALTTRKHRKRGPSKYVVNIDPTEQNEGTDTAGNAS